MDIRSFFGASSSKSTPTIDDRDTGVESKDSDSEVLGPSPAKICCTSSKQFRDKSHPLSSKRRYNKKWEKEFCWLEYDEDHQGAFCNMQEAGDITSENWRSLDYQTIQ